MKHYARSSKQFSPGNRGGALIYSLWALCLLSVFDASVGSSVNQYIRVGSYFQNSLRARYAAEAGIKAAMDILKRNSIDYDALTELWAGYDTASGKPVSLSKIPIGQGSFSIKITDESRKININTASAGTLERLVLEAMPSERDLAHTVANSILDWRDVDDGTREGGAEELFYSSLEDPYNSANRPFQVLEELLWVKGVTPELFRSIRERITVWGDGKININTASREVLISLGASDALAGKIMTYRNGRDQASGTADDQAFKRADTIEATLTGVTFLSGEEQASLNAILARNMLTVSSVYFTVGSQGYSGGRTERIVCVVDRSDRISSWRE
jgi:type II secretory pathway component PulK